MTIPRLLISGSTSGVGKTSITSAIIYGLKKRGYTVQPFKVGPDYIDPSYLTSISHNDAKNLDVWLMGKKELVKNQKKIDDKRTMALINKPNYSLLQSSLKIDDLIDPRLTTVSSILKHIHKGTIENAYTISNGEYEVIEAEIIETSELINKELKNSNLPDELRVGAVLRDKKVIIPRSNFIFKKDDRVVFIVKKESISFVENIFRLSSY